MNTRQLLGLAILIAALGIPLGFNSATSTSLQSAAVHDPAKAKDESPEEPSIDFELLGDDVLPMVVRLGGDREGKIATTIQNKDPKLMISKWRVYVALHDDEGRPIPASDVEVSISPEAPLKPNTANEFQVSFTVPKSLPRFDDKPSYAAQSLSGYFFLSSGKITKSKALQLIPYNSSPRAKWLILVGLFSAVLICSISAVRLRKRLTEVITMPDWNAGSLMTNLTIIGTVITALAAAWGVIKQPHLLQRDEYVVLSALFAALVAIAPLAFYSNRFAGQSGASDQIPKTGSVRLFLVACMFTLWGASGQYALLYYYLDEFARAHLLSESGFMVFAGAIILVGILLFLYAIRSIYSTAGAPASAALAPTPDLPQAAGANAASSVASPSEALPRTPALPQAGGAVPSPVGTRVPQRQTTPLL